MPSCNAVLVSSSSPFFSLPPLELLVLLSRWILLFTSVPSRVCVDVVLKNAEFISLSPLALSSSYELAVVSLLSSKFPLLFSLLRLSSGSLRLTYSDMALSSSLSLSLYLWSPSSSSSSYHHLCHLHFRHHRHRPLYCRLYHYHSTLNLFCRRRCCDCILCCYYNVHLRRVCWRQYCDC